MFSFIISVVLLFLHTVSAATPSQWRNRAIYQIVTDRFARTDGNTTATCNTGDRVYCGGTWKGIIQNLGYIKGMGFDAVWISPITFQLQGKTLWGESYAGYWQQDLYRLNGNFGTAADLKALSAALHAQGMYLVVDVVVNHNAWNGPPSAVNYTAFNPFNNPSNYHSFCEVDYSNTTSAQVCWLGDTNVPLPDLKTESSPVASAYQTWISQLMTNYSIDGLRLDTVLNVDPSFWPAFSHAAGSPYLVAEPRLRLPADALARPPRHPQLPAVLRARRRVRLARGQHDGACPDTSLLAPFSENADAPRFASLTGDLVAAQNVLAFTLLADGVPVVYQGQEQHYASVGGSGDPWNREALWFSGYRTQVPLYGLTQALLKLRKWAGGLDQGYWGYGMWAIYSDVRAVVVRKGYPGRQVLGVFTNVGSQAPAYAVQLGAYKTAATNGQVWVDVLGCGTVVADASGGLNVTVPGGWPRVLFPQTALKGSGFCGQ
ncbi:MAG: hypothetical protein Q9165_004518 [Trypethelium subeluteriae]